MAAPRNCACLKLVLLSMHPRLPAIEDAEAYLKDQKARSACAAYRGPVLRLNGFLSVRPYRDRCRWVSRKVVETPMNKRRAAMIHSSVKCRLKRLEAAKSQLTLADLA